MRTQAPFYLLVTLGWLTSACTSFFYYPSHETYFDIHRAANKVEVLAIATEDNLTLNGWLLEPQQAPKGAVVQFHGNAENMTSHVLFVLWLVNQGYSVVTFDYRGYGASQGKPTPSGLLSDGKAVIHYVRQHPKLKGLDLFIIGQSLGGAVAVPAIVEAGSENIKGLVLDSTFSSYRAIARDKLSSSWLTWPLHWPLSFLVPDDYSPQDYIARLHLPLLFLHGDKDPIIPKHNVDELYLRAGEPKEFWQIEGGHLAAFYDPNGPWADKFIVWLREHGSRQGNRPPL